MTLIDRPRGGGTVVGIHRNDEPQHLRARPDRHKAPLVVDLDQTSWASLGQQPCRLDGGPTQLHHGELAHKINCAHQDLRRPDQGKLTLDADQTSRHTADHPNHCGSTCRARPNHRGRAAQSDVQPGTGNVRRETPRTGLAGSPPTPPVVERQAGPPQPEGTGPAGLVRARSATGGAVAPSTESGHVDRRGRTHRTGRDGTRIDPVDHRHASKQRTSHLLQMAQGRPRLLADQIGVVQATAPRFSGSTVPAGSSASTRSAIRTSGRHSQPPATSTPATMLSALVGTRSIRRSTRSDTAQLLPAPRRLPMMPRIHLQGFATC